MTPIKYHDRPRWRESQHLAQGRAVCVALEPTAVLIRLKGLRTVLRLPLGLAYVQASRLEAQRIVTERAERRKLARQSRKK